MNPFNQDENYDDLSVSINHKPLEVQKKKFKNEEMIINDFELISCLEGKGTCDRTFSFMTHEDNSKQHPLVLAMNQYLTTPKLPLKTINLVFAKFLIELSKIANEEFYGMSASILRMLHECLSLYGYHFLIKLELQNKNLGKILSEDDKQDSFCEKENTDYICIIFDFFIKEFIRNYLKEQYFEIDFVIKFVKYFNSWLFKYQLSKLEIEYNSWE